MNVMINKYTTN